MRRFVVNYLIMSDHDESESVIKILRNQWSTSLGISDQDASEYARVAEDIKTLKERYPQVVFKEIRCDSDLSKLRHELVGKLW